VGSEAEKCLSIYPNWVGGDLEVEVVVPGSGPSKKKREKQELDPLMAQALREDDELLAVVMVAMRIMQ
jgi:hypothetical protein